MQTLEKAVLLENSKEIDIQGYSRFVKCHGGTGVTILVDTLYLSQYLAIGTKRFHEQNIQCNTLLRIALCVCATGFFIICLRIVWIILSFCLTSVVGSTSGALQSHNMKFNT